MDPSRRLLHANLFHLSLILTIPAMARCSLDRRVPVLAVGGENPGIYKCLGGITSASGNGRGIRLQEYDDELPRLGIEVSTLSLVSELFSEHYRFWPLPITYPWPRSDHFTSFV